MGSGVDLRALPACPVCGGRIWLPPLRGTALRACALCGTYLNDRAASRAEEERRYKEWSASPDPDEAAIGACQWQWMKRLLELTEIPGRLSVLDIGCGRGAFLHAARAEGARVAGIELNPAAAEACCQTGIPVTCGSLFDIGLPDGPWTAITLWDVLDHLEHPDRALRVLQELLAPGGLLVVRGRNARVHAPLKAACSRVRGAMHCARIPDLSVVHRWGLGPGGYARLLQASGLVNVRIHPGVPTPGDRYASLGPRLVARAVKGAIAVAGMGLQQASCGRLYPFPSVLITGMHSLPESHPDP